MKFPTLLYFRKSLYPLFLSLIFLEWKNIWILQKTPKCNKSWDANVLKCFQNNFYWFHNPFPYFLADILRSHISFSLYFIWIHGNDFETQNGKLFKSERNEIQKCSSSLPTLFHIFWRSPIISSHENPWVA